MYKETKHLQSNAPAPRGAIQPAKRGSVRALAPTNAAAVPTEPNKGMGRVLISRPSEAIVYDGVAGRWVSGFWVGSLGSGFDK
jgi:hypothetical protein